jgi:hypothetical protein
MVRREMRDARCEMIAFEMRFTFFLAGMVGVTISLLVLAHM